MISLNVIRNGGRRDNTQFPNSQSFKWKLVAIHTLPQIWLQHHIVTDLGRINGL